MADPKRPDNNPPNPPVNPDGATVVVPLKDLARPPAASPSPAPPADEGGVTTTVDLKQVFGGDLAKVRAEILAQLNRKAPPPAEPAPEPAAAPPPEPPLAAAPPEPLHIPPPEIPTTATVPAPAPVEPPPPPTDSPMTIIAEAPSPEEIALMKAAAGWAKAGMKKEHPPASREPQTEVIENRSTAPAVQEFKIPPDAGEATIVSMEPVYGEQKKAPAAQPMDAGDATIIASDSAPYAEPPWGGAPAGEETIVSPGIEKELRAQAASRPAAPVDADATIVQAPIAKAPDAAAKQPEAAPKAGGAFWGGATPAAPAAPKPEPAAAKPAKAPAAPPPAAKPAPPPVQAKPAPPPPPKPAPAPAPPAQQAAPPPPKRRKKISRTPLIVAVVLIFLASIAAVALFVMKDYKLSETPVSQAASVPATETAAPGEQQPAATETSAAPEPVREETPRAASEAVEENVDKMLAEVPAAQPAPPPPIRRRVVLPPPVRTEPLPQERPAETASPATQQPARTPAPAASSTLPPLEGDLVQLTEPGLTPPVLRNDEPAKYPGRARMAGAKGTVTIAIQVDQNGGVRDANIAKSSGNSLLDNAALTAARRTTWSPATVHGTRVRVWVTKQYTFGQ